VPPVPGRDTADKHLLVGDCFVSVMATNRDVTWLLVDVELFPAGRQRPRRRRSNTPTRMPAMISDRQNETAANRPAES
jgi:hypothetical protein